MSFACEIEGRILKCVDDTCLYCYLPAKDAKWGLKFLMNTDMIPNGARDNIEVEFDNTINVNVEIEKVITKKFDNIPIKVLNNSHDYKVSFAGQGQYASVSITGTEDKINALKVDNIQATIDIDGLMKCTLEVPDVPSEFYTQKGGLFYV